MELLRFEKNIDLNHRLQELISVSVQENLNYMNDEEGKRAVGTLNIEGEYLYQQQRHHFEDVIEIDILAPYNRLDTDEEFYVEIQDYDYHITSGNLSLDIHVNAYGVSKKEDRHIFIDDEQARYEEIVDLTPKFELVEAIEEVLNEKKEDLLETFGKEDGDLFVKSAIIDLEVFDDDESCFVTYPYYIVKENDTYESIGHQYQIDSHELMRMNDGKELETSCLLRLKK